ncbi:hypothetical protein [Acidocella sp.]|jgi:hypothetical protein|uniref:hypothetical protein n=1 Tax=Acidocella sp. TaxID=50710 RepID=UPI002F42C83A
MTVKQKIAEQAEAFAREIITQEFKQPASDALVQAVARKVSRAMPITTLKKITAEHERHLEHV